MVMPAVPKPARGPKRGPHHGVTRFADSTQYQSLVDDHALDGMKWRTGHRWDEVADWPPTARGGTLAPQVRTDVPDAVTAATRGGQPPWTVSGSICTSASANCASS